MLAKWTFALLAAASAAPALAQLDSLRGTIPGSLHQCEATNLFFFDSSNTRPLSVLFLPSSEVPDSIRSGTVTLDQAQQYSPLLALSDIETPDAQQYNFELQIEQGAVFEASPTPSPLLVPCLAPAPVPGLFAFLPDGQGKALSLTRTVTTPLPGASSCLTNVPTSIAGAGATTAVSAQPTSSSEVNSSTGMASSSMATSASSSSSGASQSSGGSSTSTSAPASSSSAAAGAAGGSSGASSAVLGTVDRALVVAWTAAVGGAALVGAGLLA
ncbi:hypothetical protein JCM3775_001489 [Rhodotorula graminis]